MKNFSLFFQRLDGRGVYDYRQMQITFGEDRGCCQVQLGNTMYVVTVLHLFLYLIYLYFRVMTQVSCEVTPPKPTRPSDGILFVNVELSPMAYPTFEPGGR
jgi:exosome complex component RRP45